MPSLTESVLPSHIDGRPTPEQDHADLLDPSGLVGEVRAAVEGWLAHPGQAARGRATLYLARLVGRAGWRIEGFAARGLLALAHEGGARMVAAPLAFETREYEGGSPRGIEMLRKTLAAAIPDRRYSLIIRQPVPEEFDSEALLRAVSLWCHAVRNGTMENTDALYEDHGLDIEISLLHGDPQGQESGLVFQANPTPGLERMNVVGNILLRLSRLHDPVKHLGPLLPVLHAEPGWRVTPAHEERMLYGLPDLVSSEDGTVFSRGAGLFCSAEADAMAGVLWLEGSGASPVRSWLRQNPWCLGAVDLRGVAARSYLRGASCSTGGPQTMYWSECLVDQSGR